MREADLDRHLVGEDEKKAAEALKAKLDAIPALPLVVPEKNDKGGKTKGLPTSGLPGQDGKTAGVGVTNVAALDNKPEEKPVVEVKGKMKKRE